MTFNAPKNMVTGYMKESARDGNYVYAQLTTLAFMRIFPQMHSQFPTPESESMTYDLPSNQHEK